MNSSDILICLEQVCTSGGDWRDVLKNFNSPEIDHDYIEGQMSSFEDSFLVKTFDRTNRTEIGTKHIQVKELKPVTNFSSLKLKPVSIQSLEQFKPLEFVCKRFKLIKGSLVGIVAAGGSGKSLFLQYLGLCVASGQKLFDNFDIVSGKVLHIDQEQSERLTFVRYSRIAAGMGLSSISNIDRIKIPRIDKLSNFDQVEKELVELFKDYAVVVIDSLRKITNANENTDEIEPVVDLLRRAAEKSNTLIFLIHHMGKGKSDARQSGRGHSSIYDSLDIQMDLEHDANDPTGTVVLTCAKNREGSPFNGITFRFFDDGKFIPAQDCKEVLKFECLEEENTIKDKTLDGKIKILKPLFDIGELNHSSLFSEVKGDRNLYEDNLKKCLEEKLIFERRGAKNSRIFTITPEGKTFLSYNDEGESK